MEVLLKAWEIVSLNIDNPIAATVVGIIFSYLGGTVATKGIRVFLMLAICLIKAMRDKRIDDTEAVLIFWRMVSVGYGFWPNKSRAIILKYAPSHWHKLITTGERPDFELLKVKKAPK